MKKLILLSAIAASSLMVQSASAQIHVGLHINLGTPVVYTAPAPVYREPAPVYNDADYYYLPDVEAYYSVNRHVYYYNDGRTWVSAAYLPGAYRDYDLSRARRFEVHEARPYLRNDVYRQRFGGVANRDWNRAYDRERDNHNDYRGNDRRDNDHRDYQPQQNHDYNRGQGQPQQNGNYGRGSQMQQPQQGNQQNNDRGGNRNSHDRHGI